MAQRKSVVSRQRIWQIKNREKLRAQQAVGRALLSGRLTKPAQCSRCNSVGHVQAHHHRGYEEQVRLDVEWLCSRCHVETHHRSTYPYNPLGSIEDARREHPPKNPIDIPRCEATAIMGGEELRQRRMKRNLTLKQMASLVGVSAQFLSDVERNRRHATEAIRIEYEKVSA